MGIFTSLFRRDTANHALASVTYDQQVLEYMQGGVTRELSSAIAAIYRARSMTADTVASVPLKFDSGGLVPPPNVSQDWRTFLVETVRSLTDCGDAYWRTGPNGDVEVLNPEHVTVKWTDNLMQRRAYYYRKTRIFEGVNLRVLSLDRGPGDLTGFGPMQSERIQGMLAEQRYVQEFFHNNASPVGTLMVPRTLEASEAEKLKQQWAAAQATRSPAVLSGGMEWTSTGFNASDSQWTEAHRESVGDTALLFGVPGPLLSYNTPGSSLTYASIGDLMEQWWRQTLFPSYASQIEAIATEVLGQQVRFDPEELFLKSLAQRSLAAYQLALGGWDPDSIADNVGFNELLHTGNLPAAVQQEGT